MYFYGPYNINFYVSSLEDVVDQMFFPTELNVSKWINPFYLFIIPNTHKMHRGCSLRI